MQFYCPLGHLLECDESQIGQRSRCPNCGAEFIVPQIAPAANELGRQSTGPQAAWLPAMGPSFHVGPARGAGETGNAKALETEAPVIRRPGAVFASATAATSAPDDEECLVHIPCPAGHDLETPLSMIGRDVMCPICRAEFRLHYNNSHEFRAEQQQERLRREQKLGRIWMTWSLVAAAFVLFGFALMIAVAMSN